MNTSKINAVLVIALVVVLLGWLAEWSLYQSQEARRDRIVEIDTKLSQFLELTIDLKPSRADRAKLFRTLVPLLVDIFENENEIEERLKVEVDEYESHCERSVGLTLRYYSIDCLEAFQDEGKRAFPDRNYHDSVFGELSKRYTVAEFDAFLERAFGCK